MGKRVAFIGHSNCFKFSSEQLAQVVEKLISQGYDTFAVGTHGDFDRLALIACLDVKKSHPEITIEVVLYDYRQTHPLHGEDGLPRYQHKDIQTVLYPTEELHFKQRITASLHYMIDDCDTVVCFVNPEISYGGAIKSYKYALKKGKEIINLYS